ncbi:GDSL esterase/lipase At2g19010 [Populus alba]|uniref:GDSL esterase/lipase At2g19010 n=1 Tax=Populus alba TaxID=43335 RepID=UPI00158D558C|nr:GDSL esterase/lipase At2g19010-like [Populus alba]
MQRAQLAPPPSTSIIKSHVPRYFIFGDSVADSGSSSYLQTLAKLNYSPSRINFPYGPTVRFCNGTENLGFEDFIPPFSAATCTDIISGVNYASGSPGIRDETGQELDYPTSQEDTSDQSTGLLLEQYKQQLRTLNEHGARKTVVFGLGQLGCNSYVWPTWLCFVNMLYLLALVLLIVLKSIHDVDGKSKVPCFFIFGDSLVDSGNNNYLKNKGKVNYLPYGIDFPDGSTGRFNNGRTVPDVLGELMGFKSFIKSFPTAEGSQILEGVNYGSGYAGIRDETGKHMGVLVSFNKQIQHHQVTMSRIHHILGKNHSNYLKQCLYLSMIGNNDYINNYFLPKYYNSSRHYTPKQYANVLVEEYARHLKTLHDFGARKLAIIGVAPIGCTPNATAYYGTNGSLCVKKLNKAAILFNELLKLRVQDLNNKLIGANFIYLEIYEIIWKYVNATGKSAFIL